MAEHHRRDPRQARILRNRLHPLYASLTAALTGTSHGPSGLLRRNPRAAGFIGPNGIKRIDRLNGNGVAASQRSAAAQLTELPLHRVENAEFYLVVVPDMVGGRLGAADKDILGQAHALIRAAGGQGAVVAVCFGETRDSDFETAGVDRLIQLTGESYVGFNPEARLAALQHIDAVLRPRHWLFPDSIHGGADLGSRLAARLHERPAVQAWQVNPESVVCRSSSGRIDVTRATPRILLLQDECADAVDETRHEALDMPVGEFSLPVSRITDLGPVLIDPSAVPLGEAEFILSAGNGIHNWDQFHRAAALLGATEGASRVAVDDGFMPRSRQVGATGTWVTARVYIAVGISGAVQHMQGIAQCDKVIAINSDPGCDMVKRAALSAIGDSEEVLEALMTLVRDYQNNQPNGERDAA